MEDIGCWHRRARNEGQGVFSVWLYFQWSACQKREVEHRHWVKIIYSLFGQDGELEVCEVAFIAELVPATKSQWS